MAVAAGPNPPTPFPTREGGVCAVPADLGSRRFYLVADPEGHRLMFMKQRIEDGHFRPHRLTEMPAT